MKSVLFLLPFAFLLTTGISYNILGLFPLPLTSHMTMYKKIMVALAEKGHNVDVLSHFPQNKTIIRYNDISICGSMPILSDNVSIFNLEKSLSDHHGSLKVVFTKFGLDTCRSIFSTNEAKKLRDSKKKYDLIIVGVSGSDCMIGFAYYFQVPVIAISTSVAYPWLGDRIGNSDNPSYIPNYFVPYINKITLLERVFNTLMLLESKLRYNWESNSRATELAREFFGPHLPDLQELALNTSLILVNSHFSINTARPTVPNFIEVAGLHISSPKQLPKHLKKIVDIQAKYKGVIYFSMGSMILSETFPLHILKALLYTFKNLPYKVLWKGKRERMPKDLNISQNIHFEPWLPQLDILCHPNVKLFITHGGLMGIQEAVYCGVPLLGIPLFADQRLNLMLSQAKGIAILMEYYGTSKENIFNATRTLLENPKYANNANTLSQLFRDRPASALNTAIYWIEYVIRHKGAPHLRTVGADLLWYQYFLIDVMIVLLLIVIFGLLLAYYLCKILLIKSKVFNKVKTE